MRNRSSMALAPIPCGRSTLCKRLPFLDRILGLRLVSPKISVCFRGGHFVFAMRL